MKKACKAVAFFLSIAMICSLFGCSKNADNSEIIGGADKKTNIIVSGNESVTASNNNTTNEEQTTDKATEFSTVLENGDPVISEEDAKKVAYKALEEECSNKTFADDINDFTFADIQRCDIRERYCAFNTGYDNSSYNTSGHPYYAVRYTDNSEVAGFAYFCVDLRTGDLLFSGYMGD